MEDEDDGLHAWLCDGALECAYMNDFLRVLRVVSFEGFVFFFFFFLMMIQAAIDTMNTSLFFTSFLSMRFIVFLSLFLARIGSNRLELAQIENQRSATSSMNR